MRKRSNWLILIAGVLMVMFAIGRVGSGLLGGTGSAPVPEPDCGGAIAWDAAATYVGETVTIRGPVVGTAYVPQTSGEPTFLNVGHDHPNPDRFTVVIWNDVRAQFPDRPEALFASAEICVAGEVRMHEGSPQIELAGADAITVAD
jgi:hypothetical protein